MFSLCSTDSPCTIDSSSVVREGGFATPVFCTTNRLNHLRQRCHFAPALFMLELMRAIGKAPAKTRRPQFGNDLLPMRLQSDLFKAGKWFFRRYAAIGLLLMGQCVFAQDVNVHVDANLKSGSALTGVFPTIQMALDHAPQPGPDGRLYLHLAPGVYHERVWISQLRPRTTLLGGGTDPSQVVITAAQAAKGAGGTFFTETVEVNGNGFEADNVTFENSAGPVGQAVAVSVNADRVVFKHCRFLGDQDTLFANFGRQYYVDSYISGGVDFIFGNATAVFDRSEIHSVRPGYLTAQSRTAPSQTSGYVIDRCHITTADLGGKPLFLGRPWRSYSRVVYLDTEMPAQLSPEGWSGWESNTPDPQTTFYAEHGSYGPGARVASRVSWSHQLSNREAKSYQPEYFLAGDDHWNPVAEADSLP